MADTRERTRDIEAESDAETERETEVEREREAEASEDELLCPECGGRLVSDTEHGETVCTDCGLLVETDEIERPPLGATVDLVGLDHQPTVGAHGLAVLGVAHEAAATLRAEQLVLGGLLFLFGLGLSGLFLAVDSGRCVGHDRVGLV
jgi:transcription initiation factor TFIIB